jgi:beta-lactamase class A
VSRSNREDPLMTPVSPSRRDLLKGAAAITATTAIGHVAPRRAYAQTAPASRAKIDAALKAAVDAKDVPGVVAMVATDKGLFYENAFGVRELGKGPDMTLDSVFRIASMTKAITSVAAMQMVEQGKLKLDEPVPPRSARRRCSRGSMPRARPSSAPRNGRSRSSTCSRTRPGSATSSGTRAW